MDPGSQVGLLEQAALGGRRFSQSEHFPGDVTVHHRYLPSNVPPQQSTSTPFSFSPLFALASAMEMIASVGVTTIVLSMTRILADRTLTRNACKHATRALGVDNVRLQ